MATIGLIGAGHIGSQVARLAIANGYDVVLSNSRGPETLAALVAELGPSARAATPVEAARAGDIVVVTVPLKNYRDVPVEPLAGKIVIDTNNYYPQRDGHIPELDNESTTTAELLQAHLPNSKVVKAFNHIYAAELTTHGQPAGTPNRRALVIAGDDEGAEGSRHPSARSVRVRYRGRRSAEGRLAHPARHARVWSAAHGRRTAAGPRRGEEISGPVIAHAPPTWDLPDFRSRFGCRTVNRAAAPGCERAPSKSRHTLLIRTSFLALVLRHEHQSGRTELAAERQ